MNYHIGRILLCSMCVGVSVWLGWSGIRVAGFLMSLPILFNFLCARCGWVGVVPVWQAEACNRIPLQPNHTETPTHIETITIRPMW